ncbi:hypothetical protein [Scrofimicrobium sp. R131]|uniref:Uncharacterized protein n=1 Tax=Scrofimicrobium appendicitidis TaxID=3079930 RepID=A0AAU7V9I3_9ACTO
MDENKFEPEPEPAPSDQDTLPIEYSTDDQSGSVPNPDQPDPSTLFTESRFSPEAQAAATEPMPAVGDEFDPDIDTTAEFPAPPARYRTQPAPSQPLFELPPPVGGAPDPVGAPSPEPKRASFWDKRAAVIAIAAAAGLVLGVAAGGAIAVGQQNELKAVQGQLAETESARQSAEAKLQDALDEVSTQKEQLSQYQQREDEIAEREASLAEQEAAAQKEAEEKAAAEAAAKKEAEEKAKANTFGSGTMVVGVDIQPGTYRSDASGSSCYWARLSGLSGTFDDIIANGLPDGQAVVTIDPSDKAFDSTRCGTWTRIE